MKRGRRRGQARDRTSSIDRLPIQTRCPVRGAHTAPEAAWAVRRETHRLGREEARGGGGDGVDDLQVVRPERGARGRVVHDQVRILRRQRLGGTVGAEEGGLRKVGRNPREEGAADGRRTVSLAHRTSTRETTYVRALLGDPTARDVLVFRGHDEAPPVEAAVREHVLVRRRRHLRSERDNWRARGTASRRRSRPVHPRYSSPILHFAPAPRRRVEDVRASRGRGSCRGVRRRQRRAPPPNPCRRSRGRASRCGASRGCFAAAMARDREGG